MGLGRFRVGLLLRLVIVVLAPLATSLAVQHGPAAFLQTTLILIPGLAAVTSVLMVRGLSLYAHPPPQVGADTLTRAAKYAFTVLLVIDVAHLALAVIVLFGLPERGDVNWLLALSSATYVVGLGCIGVFIVSVQRIAAFVGSTPALMRLRHLRWGVYLLPPAIIAIYLLGDALAELGEGLYLVASLSIVGGGALLMAGVAQVVMSLRENLFLTTSEFAVVSVTGERRAVDA